MWYIRAKRLGRWPSTTGYEAAVAPGRIEEGLELRLGRGVHDVRRRWSALPAVAVIVAVVVVVVVEVVGEGQERRCAVAGWRWRHHAIEC